MLLLLLLLLRGRSSLSLSAHQLLLLLFDCRLQSHTHTRTHTHTGPPFFSWTTFPRSQLCLTFALQPLTLPAPSAPPSHTFPRSPSCATPASSPAIFAVTDSGTPVTAEAATATDQKHQRTMSSSSTSGGGGRWDKLLTYETLVHAVAGSAGSVTAMSVFYPLDTIRSRLQLEKDRESKGTLAMMMEVVQQEGIESLYRGLAPVLTSLCASGFVYFYTFHGLRAVFSGGGSGSSSGSAGRQGSAVKDLALGALAGVVNVYLTTPMWVVNTRMKMQGVRRKGVKQYPKYSGILNGLLRISRDEGIATLWAGTLPSLVLVSNPAIQFMLYESLKRRWMKILAVDQLDALTIFLLGAASKTVSTIITYPLQVIQTKSRYGSDDVKDKRMMEILLDILDRDGVTSGLYKGLEAKLIQTVLTTALMYMTYEKIASFVFSLLLHGDRGRKKV